MNCEPLLSIVLPCYNEEGNLRPLIAAIRETLDPLKIGHEIIVTDDCSHDNSWGVLKLLAEKDRRIRIQRLENHLGQSAALWAGMKAARGEIIATLDSDLQNDPRDLPKFLEALQTFDCVCGSRAESRMKGDNLLRIFSSRIANNVRNRLSGETICDSGCCFRAFKRECIADLKFFSGMHRFLPTLIKLEGFSVAEIPISTNLRFSGKSNYGVWNRIFVSFYDLLAVRWMKKRMFRLKIAERIN